MMLRWVCAFVFLTLPALAQPGPVPSGPGSNQSQANVTATNGTTAQTLAVRAAQEITPFDKGAKGDCTTDDTAALQAFFNIGWLYPGAAGGVL